MALFAAAINVHYSYVDSPLIQFLMMNELHFSTTIASVSSLVLMSPALVVVPVNAAIGFVKGERPSFANNIFGSGNEQLAPEYILRSAIYQLETASCFEVGHLLQSIQRNQVQFFDFRDPIKNQLAYGALDIPQYDLANIQPRSLSVWQGNTDRLVNQYDNAMFLNKLNSK